MEEKIYGFILGMLIMGILYEMVSIKEKLLKEKKKLYDSLTIAQINSIKRDLLIELMDECDYGEIGTDYENIKLLTLTDLSRVIRELNTIKSK